MLQGLPCDELGTEIADPLARCLRDDERKAKGKVEGGETKPTFHTRNPETKIKRTPSSRPLHGQYCRRDLGQGPSQCSHKPCLRNYVLKMSDDLALQTSRYVLSQCHAELHVACKVDLLRICCAVYCLHTMLQDVVSKLHIGLILLRLFVCRRNKASLRELRRRLRENLRRRI